MSSLSAALQVDLGDGQTDYITETVWIYDKDKKDEILQQFPNYKRWWLVAPIKSKERMEAKVAQYEEERAGVWPFASQLGDALRAMIVCRGGSDGGDDSGDTIYRTWLQLQKVFGIQYGHGRLKNNFRTAGVPHEDPQVHEERQKPPDMLMNVVVHHGSAMQMPAEIQVAQNPIIPVLISSRAVA